MLSVIKEIFYDFIESMEEYKTHKGIGFNLYSILLTSIIPITFIFLGIVIPNNPHFNLIFGISIFFIELVLFLIFPYNFYKKNFGSEVKLKNPHRYLVKDNKNWPRLEQIILNEDSLVEFSFYLTFGKKMVKLLNNCYYDIIFEIAEYIKITPRSVGNDTWFKETRTRHVLRCFYQNETEKQFAFKIEFDPNFMGTIYPGKCNMSILYRYTDEKQIHIEKIEIIN